MFSFDLSIYTAYCSRLWFLSQRVSNAEIVPMSWRHDECTSDTIDSRYIAVKYNTMQHNNFEGKASVRLRSHERHPYVALTGELWSYLEKIDREISRDTFLKRRHKRHPRWRTTYGVLLWAQRFIHVLLCCMRYRVKMGCVISRLNIANYLMDSLTPSDKCQRRCAGQAPGVDVMPLSGSMWSWP